MLSIGLLTLCSEEAHLKRGAHIAHSASLCSNYYPLMQVLEWFSACVVEREDLHPSNEQRVQDAGAQRVVSRLALLVRTLLHNVPNQDAATNQAVRLKK
jgi:hypothetical protein